MPIKRNLKWCLTVIPALLVVLTLGVSVTVGGKWMDSKLRTIYIHDGDNVIEVRTMKDTVGDVLEQANVELSNFDEISADKNETIGENTKDIYIKRAVPVRILADNTEKLIYTTASTVEEVLEENNVTLSAMDKLDNVEIFDAVKNEMNISILRIDDEIVKEQSSVAFETIRKANASLYKGEEKVVTQGVNGVREKTFRILYQDGKITGQTLINDVIVKEPVDKVVEYGTKALPTATPKPTKAPAPADNGSSGSGIFSSSRGVPVEYTKSYSMKASAYTCAPDETGKDYDHPYYGITASGMKAQVGVIAVDRNVIPLGTKLYVEGTGSSKDYGFCIAGDVGGGIKGMKVDLYMNTKSECFAWGRRFVKVYVLEDQSVDIFKLRANS